MSEPSDIWDSIRGWLTLTFTCTCIGDCACRQCVCMIDMVNWKGQLVLVFGTDRSTAGRCNLPRVHIYGGKESKRRAVEGGSMTGKLKLLDAVFMLRINDNSTSVLVRLQSAGDQKGGNTYRQVLLSVSIRNFSEVWGRPSSRLIIWVDTSVCV